MNAIPDHERVSGLDDLLRSLSMILFSLSSSNFLPSSGERCLQKMICCIPVGLWEIEENNCTPGAEYLATLHCMEGTLFSVIIGNITGILVRYPELKGKGKSLP